MGAGSVQLLSTFGPVALGATAWSVLGVNEELFDVDGSLDSVSSVLGLGEFVDGLIVAGVELFGEGDVVPFLRRPGVFGSNPATVRLNLNVVDAFADLDESLVAPVGAPRVADQPVLSASLVDTISDNRYGMIDVFGSGAGRVTEDSITGLVLLKALSDGNRHRDGSVVGELFSHVLGTGDVSPLGRGVHFVGLRDDAGFAGSAVAAQLHWRAGLAVGPATGGVDGAGPVCDVVVDHPLESIFLVATEAAEVIVRGDG